jgi:hypothetical protein
MNRSSSSYATLIPFSTTSDAHLNLTAPHLINLSAMMDSSFLQLLIFCAVMFFGSYLAGSAPLVIGMSEEKLHRVSVLGAGLLVGTALAVIVPEGVQGGIHQSLLGLES